MIVAKELMDWDEFRTRKEEANPRNGYAIPIENIKELIYSQKKGSPIQIMILWLALTGCRIEELDRMTIQGFKGHYFFWKKGKNQKGSRYVYIPEYAIKLLKIHKEQYPTLHNKLFSMSSQTMRRKISSIRPTLSQKWNKKVTDLKKNIISEQEYELQIKGIRKTYVTFKFYEYYNKFKNYEVAGLMVAKDMGHSTKDITFRHYIEDGEKINIKKWIQQKYHNLFQIETQQKINENQF